MCFEFKRKRLGIVKRFCYFVSKWNFLNQLNDIDLMDLRKFYPDRKAQYSYFHSYYWHRLPQCFRDHRNYFKQGGRGFGEDAFYAMWYFLFRYFRPRAVLEIGVFRGQIISLWTVLSRELSIPVEVHGLSPFEATSDSVTQYPEGIDYHRDVILNLRQFEGINLPHLHKAYSTDEEGRRVISSRKWDIIYIDGDHDYNVVKSDFSNCSKQLSLGGLIVLDDASLYVEYHAPVYASSGHPGPSRVAEEIDDVMFTEIFSCGHNRVFMKVAER